MLNRMNCIMYLVLVTSCMEADNERVCRDITLQIGINGSLEDDLTRATVTISGDERSWTIASNAGDFSVDFGFPIDVATPPSGELAFAGTISGAGPFFDVRTTDSRIVFQFARIDADQPGQAIKIGSVDGQCNPQQADQNRPADSHRVRFLWDEETEVAAPNIVDGTIGGEPVRGMAVSDGLFPSGFFFRR